MTVRQPYTDPPLNVQNIVLAVAASAAGDAAGGNISSERRRKRGQTSETGTELIRKRGRKELGSRIKWKS